MILESKILRFEIEREREREKKTKEEPLWRDFRDILRRRDYNLFYCNLSFNGSKWEYISPSQETCSHEVDKYMFN
jgi:HSP90 family molecular chaperone